MAFPTEERFVQAAEAALGITFPSEHRTRLLANNGGEVYDVEDPEEGYWFLYPVYDDSDRKKLSRSANHIVKETENWRHWEGFPAEAVAIAEDQAGNALILLPGDDQIYAWWHEGPDIEPVTIDFEEDA